MLNADQIYDAVDKIMNEWCLKTLIENTQTLNDVKNAMAEAYMKGQINQDCAILTRLKSAISRMETIQETNPEIDLEKDISYYKQAF